MRTLTGLLLCGFFAVSLPATSMLPLSLEDMEAAASEIVVVTCTARDTHWSGRTIVTEYTLEVSDAVKGSPTRTLQLVLPGGSVKSPDPVTMRVPGVPRLRLKQRALLFLETARSGKRTVVGWEQGCFPITRDAQGRELVRVPPSQTPRGKAALAPGGRIALDELIAQIDEAKRQRQARHN